MSSFIIKSFKGALSDYENVGIQGAFKFGSGLDIRKRKDSLSAQQGLADDLATGTFDAEVVSVVVSADGNSYWGLANGKIYKRTSGGTYSLVYTETDGVITGMGEWVNNVGDTFLYWATLTELHRKRLIGTGYTNTDWTDVDATVNSQTYPKANLTSSTNHAMKPVNGIFLICNDNTMAMVGYDDSYTNNSLQLIPGNSAKTMFDAGLNVKIAANRKDQSEGAMLYIWDTLSQNYNDKMPLPFSSLNAMIETEVGIVQYGTNGDLYFYGDSTKLPVMAFPGGGQVAIEGVENDSGLALLGSYGNGTGKTGIYTYGRKRKNADFVLNLEYPFDATTITAVKKIGSTILFAYKIAGTPNLYGVKKVDSANKVARAVYQSLDLRIPDDFDRDAEFTKAEITMAPLPAGCSIELWRRVDKVDVATPATGVTADGWKRCNTEDVSAGVKKYLYDNEGGRKATFLIGDRGSVLELMVVLNCTGNYTPDIYKIKATFK